MAMDAGELRNTLKIAAAVLARGERPATSPEHWQALTVRQHVAHALQHLDKYVVNANSGVDDLAHALVRLLLAVELRERQRAALEVLRTAAEQRRAR